MKFPALLLMLLVPTVSLAGMEAFHPGPLIPGYGRIVDVNSDLPLPPNAHFKVMFSAKTAGEAGKVNRGFDSLARFLNMHVANGVPAANIELALVVHGPASLDLLGDAALQGRKLSPNPNRELIAGLLKHGVRIYLCGQSAAAYDIRREELLPGVQLVLSAMTAHALLAQQGYSLNPF